MQSVVAGQDFVCDTFGETLRAEVAPALITGDHSK